MIVGRGAATLSSSRGTKLSNFPNWIFVFAHDDHRLCAALQNMEAHFHSGPVDRFAIFGSEVFQF